MITWEYAYVFVGIRGSDHIVAGINGQPLDVRGQPQTPWEVLNAMGAEGWEFVTAMPTAPLQLVRQGQEDVPESYWIFYLKRPRGVAAP